MGELKAMREEVEILAYRSSDHDDRIVILEELHTDAKSHSHISIT